MRRSDYRVLKNESDYIVQYRFLKFFWKTEQVKVSDYSSSNKSFKTQKEAENYIEEQTKTYKEYKKTHSKYKIIKTYKDTPLYEAVND